MPKTTIYLDGRLPMGFTTGIPDVIGKRVIGVAVGEAQQDPRSRLYLVFDDGTYYELFAAAGYIEGGSRCYPGDLYDVLTLLERDDLYSIRIRVPPVLPERSRVPHLAKGDAWRIHTRHYVRHASAPNHWFDFSRSKVESYLRQFGERFCLVVNGSDDIDDAYVLPYGVARHIFRDACVDERGRWVGTILAHRLRVPSCRVEVDVGSFHNAFYLLD